MIRKTSGFTAFIAAAVTITLAGAESSGANAQVAAQTTKSTTVAAPLTEEVVPTFVAKEVVQALPEEAADETPASSDESPRVSSLRELVSAMPAKGELSEELQCLAGAVYFEARGEPLDGQLAVADVIVNRAADGRFPSSYCGVVFQRSQFSFVRGGRMPKIRTGSQAWANARAIAQIAHRGLWDSRASDALYFHARYVKPSWSQRKVALATIDTHVFYR